jgi:pteridine reductase
MANLLRRKNSKTGLKPTAFVTGAASTMGRAISLELAQGGYDLILHYGRSLEPTRKLQGDLRELGCESVVLQADLEHPGALSRVGMKAHRHFKRLKLLVHNASLFDETSSDFFDEKSWKKILNINLLAPTAISLALHPFLEKNKGNIVHITDIYGEHPALKNHSAYCVSKGGLITMTKFLAAEWGPGVRVNAVSPGVISFPKNYTALKKKKLTQKSALKKGGTPEDVARAVLFLSQNPFVTGQVLNVDGGRFL